jgi:Fe-S cluster assembly ATP-binding protein
MKDALVINNLHVETIEGKKILEGVSLAIKKGEIHAIMGPNGGGKSTLAQVLMGHPGYVITKGTIHLNGVDIAFLSPDLRAKHGLFLGFQYPVEVSGVNFSSFLRMAINENQELRSTPRVLPTSRGRKNQGKKVSPIAFRNLLEEQAKPLMFREDIGKRSLNEGFSGGEKKKAEILQMALLRPDFAILDEPDSGLDVDALKYIAKTLTSLDFLYGLVLITHYQRILQYIKPDFVHILVQGNIVKSGDYTLAKEIEEKGYEGYLG